MFLPRIPYTFQKRQRETVSFGGINRTENIKDGEIRDGAGVSSALSPVLSQSLPFAEDTSYGEGVADMFEHNGILSYVKDGMLYYDGKAVAKVQSGKKQWAVVNTKLCVFPDKIAVDIKDGSVLHMEKDLMWDMSKNTTTIKPNKIAVATKTEKIASGLSQEFDRTGLSGAFAYACMYTYGIDPKAIEAAYRRGEWQNLERYETLKDICYNNTGKHIEVGDIVIPEKLSDGSFRLVGEPYKLSGGQIPEEYYPDKTRYNQEGYYAVIKSYVTDLDRGADTDITYDVYKTEGADLMLYNEFEAGDAVTISGTPFGIMDAEKIVVQAVDRTANALIFDDAAIRNAMYYYILPDMIPSGQAVLLSAGGVYISITSEVTLLAGSLLYTGWVGNSNELAETVKVYLWDEQSKKNEAEFDGVVFDSWQDGMVSMLPYETVSGEITVKAAIPDLDYICESENRLWGVSNETGTIYASELGVPHRFYTYGDSSTDSYAVAVGSEDEFTAVCSFGGGVCCFKENKLHKILGSFPAEYYMQEYEIAGVQKGAEKTLCVINEVLFYKGVHGVYAYTGGTPRLISYELGEKGYTATAAGTDGRAYYIGMSGAWGDELLAYDIAHDMWMPDSKILAEAVCSINGKVYILNGGKVFRQTEDIKNSAWRVELVPTDEMVWSKKGYSRIVLKAEMERGSNMSVYIRLDRGHWVRALTKAATMDMTTVIPLHIGRCDRCEIKIEGQGKVMLRGMLREFGEGRI